MGRLASLRSDDSDQGVSFDTLVGTQSRLQKGGLRPSVWLHFLKKKKRADMKKDGEKEALGWLFEEKRDGRKG